MKNLIKLKNNIWFKRSFYVLSIILILISALRVPYVGQFFDSTIFSFMFGYSKYILYTYIIIILVLKLFNFKRKAIYQKRFMLMILIGATLFSILLGGIEIISHNNFPNLVGFYINNVWYETLWNFNNYFVFGVNGFIDGGLIGTFFASISGVFIILFSLILLTVTYFCFFKSHWQIIKIKIVNIFQKSKKIKLKTNVNKKNANYIDTLLNREKISKLNLNELNDNKINIENEIGLLSDFLNDNKIIFTKIESTKNENNYCLNIKANSEQLSKIYTLKDSFKLIGLNNQYCLITTDEVVRIEYPINKPIVNYVLKNFLDTEVSIPLEFALGLYENNKPVFFNLMKDNLFGIFDPKNINTNNFINILISSISSHYDKQNISIFYLNPIGEKRHLLVTDLLHTEQILSLSNIRNYVSRLKTTIDNLNNKMKKLDVNNIYKLNNKSSEIYKNKIIIIDHINIIKSEDQELYNNICALQQNATSSGITFLLFDHSDDGISFDDFKYEVIFGFVMNVKLSKKLFDSSSAYGIQKHNEAILSRPNGQLKSKVIIPNISESEILSLEQKFNNI